MNRFIARIMLLSSQEPTVTDKIKYAFNYLLAFAPVAFILDQVNWWFSENKQFGTFMCLALIINMIVGLVFHLKRGSFKFGDFLKKNLEMVSGVIVVYIMLEMLRYTAGDNIAGEIFKILIQVTTLLYPTSKVLKNWFIMTGGKYPPEFLMTKLYNFEKNGDLSQFFKPNKDAEV